MGKLETPNEIGNRLLQFAAHESQRADATDDPCEKAFHQGMAEANERAGRMILGRNGAAAPPRTIKRFQGRVRVSSR